MHKNIAYDRNCAWNCQLKDRLDSLNGHTLNLFLFSEIYYYPLIAVKGTRCVFGGKLFILSDIENENSFRWGSNHSSVDYGSNSTTQLKSCIK